MKKFLALVLAMIMVLGLVACGGSNDNSSNGSDTTPPASNNDSSSNTDTPAEPAPAASDLDPVTLKMWLNGNTVTPDASKTVMAELNAYLQEKINVTLEPIWGTWGDFDPSVTTALPGGDDVDIYFTCNWSADEYLLYSLPDQLQVK